MFLCLKIMKPVAKCGFVNQDFDWDIMPKGLVPALWLLPESFEELRLIFKANESPLEKWPGTLFGHVFHGRLYR